MSNESSQHLTQFQQKAQLRLQEMEVEWHRTLFERFRTICREEMMDVMKALMSNIPPSTPEELNARLEELKQSAQNNQMELFTTLTQTSEEVRNISKKLEEPLAPDPKMVAALSQGQEAIAAQVTSKQDESTKALQEDVRQSAKLSMASLKKAVLVMAGVCILLCAGLVAALHYLAGSALVSNTDMDAARAAAAQKAAAQADLKTLNAEKGELQKNLDTLKAQRDALSADIRQTTAMQATLTASLGTLQQQVAQLQQIQEQFRFKLVKGEAGGVFVEIPPEAEPFEYSGKTFIQVK